MEKVDYVEQFYKLSELSVVKDNKELISMLREFYKIEKELQEEQHLCQEMISRLKRKMGIN